MVQKFQIFNPKYNDDELDNEFHNFFYKYNLTSLFTNEHRASEISVTYIDAKSVTNPDGSYHKTLKEFSEYLTIGNDNKSYEEAMFKLIYEARSFQALINSIKKLMDYIKSLDSNHLFNLWNIVWYDKDVN